MSSLYLNELINDIRLSVVSFANSVHLHLKRKGVKRDCSEGRRREEDLNGRGVNE